MYKINPDHTTGLVTAKKFTGHRNTAQVSDRIKPQTKMIHS